MTSNRAPTAIVGPPGTGKTHSLIEIVRQHLRDGVPPESVGFFSFSRKAAEEARDRAIAELNLDPKRLLHFRTLPSLAFRQLGLKRSDVIGSSDYTKLEKMLGVEFQSSRSMSVNDGEFFRLGRDGDMYLSVINMARTKGVDLEKQFNEFNNPYLDFRQLKIIDEAYTDYKESTNKIDFVDMIESFIDSPDCPKLDLLIVDEAQDLVPLQWEMVDKLIENSKQTYYAGDDDQAIYEWMGVDPDNFISRCASKRVLDQSFRVPKAVHDLSLDLIKGVEKRVEKNWNPVSHEGSVSFHFALDEIDMREGEWLILCRTNHILNKVAKDMKDWGLLYWREGAGYSASTRVLTAAQAWTRLSRGDSISKEEAKVFMSFVRVDKTTRKIIDHWFKYGEVWTTTSKSSETFTMDNFRELTSLNHDDKKWFEVLDIPDTERVYIQSVLRAGEKFGKDPRIRLSTIHKAKGGEADNVVLFLDSSKACQTLSDQDCEKRVFYVGMTRARQNLHLIEGSSRWSFKI